MFWVLGIMRIEKMKKAENGKSELSQEKLNEILQNSLSSEKVGKQWEKCTKDIQEKTGEAKQKVIDFVIEKYGASQVAQIITYGTMAAKSSIRDTARALDLPLHEADRIAKLIPMELGITLKDAIDKEEQIQQRIKNFSRSAS